MTKETLHVRRRRATAQEDFAPDSPLKEEESASTFNEAKRDLDQMSLLDMFSMMASAGVSQRTNDPEDIALQSYQIGLCMLKQSQRHKP